MYHYDPATGPVPAGFSPAAINLSVKCVAGMKPGEPRSPGAASVMDLSTSNVTSTSPQVVQVILNQYVRYLAVKTCTYKPTFNVEMFSSFNAHNKNTIIHCSEVSA